MTLYFPIVIERERNGTFSAWVAGLPGVYAAADTAAAAKRAIQGALDAHLDALQRLDQLPDPQANVYVLRYDSTARTRATRLRPVGVAALMGRATSQAKVTASRRNGAKGGRPRKAIAR